MSRFLKHLFTLIFTLIALMYLSDIIYTHIYLRSTPRNKLQYILNTKNKKFDVVFLGSSRVANHIDTKLFDSLSSKKTINLGCSGAGLNDNLLQLKLLLANNTVSNLFLQIDFNYEYQKPSNISISETMPFLNNKIISTHLKKYFNNLNKLKYIPFYRYAVNDPKIGFRELFFSLINKKPRTNPSIGFTPKYGNNISSKESILPKSIKPNNKVLDEISDICKKNKIKLTLFVSPLCNKTKNMNYIAKLIEKYPNLINLSTGYNDDLFFNCSHLNNKGARVFTTDLYNASKSQIPTVN